MTEHANPLNAEEVQSNLASPGLPLAEHCTHWCTCFLFLRFTKQGSLAFKDDLQQLMNMT